MATPPITRAQTMEARNLHKELGTWQKVGDKLGISRMAARARATKPLPQRRRGARAKGRTRRLNGPYADAIEVLRKAHSATWWDALTEDEQAFLLKVGAECRDQTIVLSQTEVFKRCRAVCPHLKCSATKFRRFLAWDADDDVVAYLIREGHDGQATI